MDSWTIVLAILVITVVYWFSTRNHDYFKKRGVPYVRPWPIFGNMGELIFQTKSMPHAIQDIYNSSPDAKYVGFYDFRTPIVLLRDPELIKQVTIKHFDSFANHKMFVDSPTEQLFQKNLFALKDDEWREMRTLLSPAFTSSKMKMMFKIVSRCAVDFAEFLAAQDPQPEAHDVKDSFGRYTLDVIASTAFGLSTNSMKDRDNTFYTVGRDVTNFAGVGKMIKFFVIRCFPRLASFFKVQIIGDKATDYFKDVIKTNVETRDREGIVRPDMIQLMMQAGDRKDKSSLSLDDMTAQAFIFLLGGLESPATTMSFATQVLALNPDVRTKLRAEIDEVLENNADGVSYEDLHAMKYLDAVVNETLRMFTPAFALDRIASKEYTLPPALPGLEPMRIEPSQGIWIPVHALHYDEKYYPNPDEFDPERFSDVNKDNVNSSIYIPFGIGPRICIANRFALMVMKLALFHLLAKCDVLPCSKTNPKIKISTKAFTLQPEGGFWLKIQARK